MGEQGHQSLELSVQEGAFCDKVCRKCTSGMSRRFDQRPVVGRAKPPGSGIFCPLASRMSPPVAKALRFFWSTSSLGSSWMSGLGFLQHNHQALPYFPLTGLILITPDVCGCGNGLSIHVVYGGLGPSWH